MAMDIVPSAARTKRRAPSTDSVIEIKDESDDVSTSRSELQALKKLKVFHRRLSGVRDREILYMVYRPKLPSLKQR